MKQFHALPSAARFSTAILYVALLSASSLHAQNKVVDPAPTRIQEVPVGPYAAHIAAGGHTMPPSSAMLWANGVSTLLTWGKIDAGTPATALLVGVVAPLVSAPDSDHPQSYEFPFEHFGGTLAHRGERAADRGSRRSLHRVWMECAGASDIRYRMSMKSTIPSLMPVSALFRPISRIQTYESHA